MSSILLYNVYSRYLQITENEKSKKELIQLSID